MNGKIWLALLILTTAASAQIKLSPAIFDGGTIRGSSGQFSLLGKARGTSLSLLTNSQFKLREGFLKSVYAMAERVPAPKVEPREVEIVGAVTASRNPFNPLTGPTTFKYELNKDVVMVIYIYNLRGERVWEYTAPAGSPGGQAGLNEVSWNGITSFKQLALAEVYIVHFNAQTAGGQKNLAKYKLAVTK